MKNNVSIFKKIKIFNSFRKTIKSIKNELQNEFNIRVDNSYRMYTVLNIPEDIIGEAYVLRKSDIDKISENYTREFSISLSNFLNSKNLNELYRIYEIKKVDKYSYLIVVGFSLFKSNEFYDKIYYRVLPITLISLICGLLFLMI
jgi:hypothetical protein